MISLSKKRFAILLAVMLIQPLLGLVTAAYGKHIFRQNALIFAAMSSECEARKLDVAIQAIDTGERSPEKLVGARSTAEVTEWKTKALNEFEATVKQIDDEKASTGYFGIALAILQLMISVLTFGALISRTTIGELRKK